MPTPDSDALQKAQEERDEARAALEKAQAEIKKLGTGSATPREDERFDGDDDPDNPGDTTDAPGSKKTVSTSLDHVGENEVSKSELAKLSPEARQAVLKAQSDRDQMRKDMDVIRKQAETATQVAKAERDARITREFVAKAEALDSLSQSPAEFGPVLKRLSENVSDADFAALTTVLKAADEAVRSSAVFKEAGIAGGAVRAESAYAEVVRRAEEIRKSDPKMAKRDAEDLVMKNDPDLQRRHIAEMQGAQAR
jgi:uncharacterized protein (DUF885 family)